MTGLFRWEGQGAYGDIALSGRGLGLPVKKVTSSFTWCAILPNRALRILTALSKPLLDILNRSAFILRHTKGKKPEAFKDWETSPNPENMSPKRKTDPGTIGQSLRLSSQEGAKTRWPVDWALQSTRNP